MADKGEGTLGNNPATDTVAPVMRPVPNRDLRKQIVEMVYRGKDGHIPSAFSLLEIITVLYRSVLRVDPASPRSVDRDYFILSKGHGCLALYVNLFRHGFVTESDIQAFCTKGGILGEHPDRTKVPGVEASTGSLGHGLSFAAGIALGLQIQKRDNRVFVVLGDGECHEGTVWEAAHLARNLNLGNLCALVDWNESGMQLLPHDDLPAKWRAFGWHTQVVDGHNEEELLAAISKVQFDRNGTPSMIVARTTKGKGVPFIEGHGKWHHRIPDAAEFQQIIEALS
jgi:transketolase